VDMACSTAPLWSEFYLLKAALCWDILITKRCFVSPIYSFGQSWQEILYTKLFNY